MNQSFINGFVKRALDYGFTENEALEFYKVAEKNDHTGRNAGAIGGGIVGYKPHLSYQYKPTTPLKKGIRKLTFRHDPKGAVIGSLVGGATGMLYDHFHNKK